MTVDTLGFDIYDEVLGASQNAVLYIDTWRVNLHKRHTVAGPDLGMHSLYKRVRMTKACDQYEDESGFGIYPDAWHRCTNEAEFRLSVSGEYQGEPFTSEGLACRWHAERVMSPNAHRNAHQYDPADEVLDWHVVQLVDGYTSCC